MSTEAEKREAKRLYDRAYYVAHRPPPAVDVVAEAQAEAEAAQARAAEVETRTIQIAAQLPELPLNRWVKLSPCSSSGIAEIVSIQIDGRFEQSGRVRVRCQHRDCDVFVLRQGTVTQ